MEQKAQNRGCRRLNKRGAIMIVVVLFVLLFSSVAVTLELTLLQRVEGRRYAQRNNAIYTADAMMDLYIYANAKVLGSPSKPYTSGPLLTDAKINDYATEMGDSICEAIPGGKRMNLRDIYQIVPLMAFDKPEITSTLLDVMFDQVVIDNTLVNATPFQIDWVNPETVFNGDADDVFVLRPVKVVYREYFKSYTVEKVVTFNNLYLRPTGTGPMFTLTVDTNSMVMLVEEYNCYE